MQDIIALNMLWCYRARYNFFIINPSYVFGTFSVLENGATFINCLRRVALFFGSLNELLRPSTHKEIVVHGY